MFPIKNIEDFKKLNELVSLQNQLNEVRLQNKLRKQNFPEDIKKVFEPVTKSLENTSRDIAKTVTETSINSNKAIENLNEKVLKLMNDKGIKAPDLASFLFNLFKPENKSQFRLIKDQFSIRMNDFLINGGITVSLYSNMSTFTDSNKSFKLDGDLLGTMTNYDFNVDHSNPQDQKMIYELGKEMKFDIRQKGRKGERDKSMIRLLISPRTLASGISNIIFLSSSPNEICDRLMLIIQEKQAGNNSELFNWKNFAIVDKLLEYKCISKEKHKQILIKCNLLNKQV